MAERDPEIVIERRPPASARPAENAKSPCHLAKAAKAAKVQRPLDPVEAPGVPFPTAALPPAMKDAVAAIANIVQVPDALAAGSILAAASLGAQAHADVLLPVGEGRPVPLSLFLVTIAPSGSRKSTADGMAMAAVCAFEDELAGQRRERWAAYQADHEAWDAARKRAISAGKGDRAAIRDALIRLGPEPVAPPPAILTATEPTMQGLDRLFRNGRPSLGLFSDEGGAMIGGWSLSEEQRLATAAALNSLWDGGSLKRVRAADDAAALPGRRLSLHLMSQPIAAERLLGSAEVEGVGLLARCLITKPPELFGTRLYRDPNPSDAAALQAFSRRLAALLRADLPVTDSGALEPRQLPMNAAARSRWIAYSDECERKLADGAEWEAIRPFGAKAAEHAARLAGVMTVFSEPDTTEIGEGFLAAGEALAAYYAAEALRLRSRAMADPGLIRARQALGWLRAGRRTLVSVPCLSREGPRSLRTAEAAREALETLEAHGWLEPIEGGAAIGDDWRREAWAVHLADLGT